MFRTLLCFPIRILNMFRGLDFLAPLALRLYLVPVMWQAGTRKINNIDDVASWFANGLQLPYPTELAYLVAYSETIGAICLLVGFAVRIISIPLMIIMLVAAWTVHFVNGWSAIAPESAEASVRLSNFMEWLQHYFPERYAYITELGSPVMLQNGIQFAITFFIMLLTLFFIGSGRYVSVDYWIQRKYQC